MLLLFLGLLFGFLFGIFLGPLQLIWWLKKREEVLIVNYVEWAMLRVPKEKAAEYFPEFAEGFKKNPLLVITTVPN